ncbi:MAG: c-type cytochrome biogenesis protein CcmI [Gammaproteobacteria bacterium]|nr:MAG: c-type cytochrome biogenesis protein CcmI [Gammaproteobacteria bacterium]
MPGTKTSAGKTLMTAFILLTVGVLVYLLYPVRQQSIEFDEKDEAIKIYREEVAYIEQQHQKRLIDDTDKAQLLQELERQSVLAMLAIEQRTFAYRRSLVPTVFIVVSIMAGVSLYAHFYEKKGIGAWQRAGSEFSTAALLGLFDQSYMHNFITTHNDREIGNYCFLMQRELLKKRVQDADVLLNVARCHLLRGSPELAEIAVSRALRNNPNNASGIYLLAELEFSRYHQLSDSTGKKLTAIAREKPSTDILYLLMLNSYTRGEFRQAKSYVHRLRPLIHQRPMLAKSLDAIEAKIDAQLPAYREEK